MPELTTAQLAQLDRQDIVDNACFALLNDLYDKTNRLHYIDSIEWDIELISKVREAVQEVLVNDLHLMTEMQFYPYVELCDRECLRAEGVIV